jgi:hypothetical protein
MQRTNSHIVILLLIAMLFSCSTNENLNLNTNSVSVPDTTNFWLRNTLKQLNIKGNVRVMSVDGLAYYFEKNGYLSCVKSDYIYYQYSYDANNRNTNIEY